MRHQEFMIDFAAIAKTWGIDLRYHDMFGRAHDAPLETVSRLVEAMSARGVYPQDFSTQVETLRAFQGDGRRYWALAVQLYAVRSRRNWGHGDFTDLLQLIDIAAYHGAAAIGLNPLHALFGGQASPYYPSSRQFLHTLYIDVEAVPEFSGGAACGLAAKVEALRIAELIDYEQVARVKIVALRTAYASFRAAATPERRADFAAFRADHGDALARFASFQYLWDRFAPAPWRQWPQPWQNPTAADLAALRSEHVEDCEFHEFTQWLADRQLKTCRDRALGCGLPIGLYLDLAVGVDPHGADAWSGQDVILTGFSIGAPADDFNPSGQNWGLAPFNPHALARDDFALMRNLLRASMRRAGALRLDHVLGLKRLFMIPDGSNATEGTYVAFPFEQLLRIVAEESRRFRCVIVGEDLGTVPDGFREALSRWGLWMYRVMLFERDAGGRLRPPESYPEEAVATCNTHDMPTLQSWKTADDLRLRRFIAVDSSETEDSRAQWLTAVRAALAEYSGQNQDIDIAAIAQFLAKTPSRLVVVSLEDVLGMSHQINIPGTVEQYPNWRHRLAVPIEALKTHVSMLRVAQAFRQNGRT
jgi:4-alpha-glucanotransferase